MSDDKQMALIQRLRERVERERGVIPAHVLMVQWDELEAILTLVEEWIGRADSHLSDAMLYYQALEAIARPCYETPGDPYLPQAEMLMVARAALGEDDDD